MTVTDTFDSPMLISRRGLIKGAAGALALFTIDMSPLRRVGSALAAPDLVNGWIQINADNTVTVAFCAGELGQGIMTGLAQWAAEELMVDWGQVRAELVPPGRTLAASSNTDIGYGTGGSKGMVNRYGHMRKAGLEARLKLQQASGGTAVGGGQLQLTDGSTQPYSAFAAAAVSQSVTMPVQAAASSFPAPFVQPEAFKIVGKGTDVVRRLDIPDKVNGKAKYGLDVRIPGMVYAVVKNCPTWSGTLDPAKVPAPPAGTSKVVPLKPWVAIDSALGLGTPMALGPAFNAVAVVAPNTWIAKNAAAALTVSWTIPAAASKMSSTTMLTQAQSLITSTTLTTTGTSTTPPQLITAEKVGDAPAAFAAAPVKVDQYYQLPNIPHVMMEVPNATVRVNADGTAECWAPTQSPPNARIAVAKVLGIPTANVTVYPQLCGGGLGRRIDTDVIAQAAQVAKAMPVGTPVMLVWPREEDLAHDQPRPAVYARAMFGYDPATAKLTSFNVRNVSQSPSYQRNPFKVDKNTGLRAPSADNVEGAKNSAYKRAVANILVEHVLQNSDPMTSTPTGYWRSVGASTMCFVVESAMDELAAAAGVDPFTLRRNLLASSTDPADIRMVAVMDSAKSMIELQVLPAGSARGYAISEAFGTKAAVAVEVTKNAVDGTLQVKRVALSVDPGFVVNPDQVRAQMEGGIIHGISSAMWGRLVWSSGKANSSNFSNTRVLRMAETPAMQIDVRSSGNLADIGGTGEVPVPLMAPAMANAWFALTATRVRVMPFYPGAKMSG